jgi:hypothetical protein
MAFSISPAVTWSEIDLTTVVPTVATTIGGIAGVFEWGPVDFRVLNANEDEIVRNYGKPTASNFETWFVAASFTAYGDKLYVSRAASNVANNAVAFVGGTGVNRQVKNEEDYAQNHSSFSANSHYYAKYPGTMGNSLRIATCDSPNAFSSTIYTDDANNLVTIDFSVGSNSATLTVNSATSSNASVNTTANTVLSLLSVGDYLVAGNTTVGSQNMKITALSAPSVTANAVASATISLETKYFLSENTSAQSSNTTDSAIDRLWEFYNLVDSAPGTSSYAATRNANGESTFDELHAVITDAGGVFTGTPGTILEVWPNLSRATDATGEEGGSIYYKNVLNEGSRYVWYSKDRAGAASALASAIVPSSNAIPYAARFSGGTQPDTETAVSISALARAYDKFKSAEDVDVSLIMAGKARGGVHGEQLANYIIDNIAEYRKDCVVLVSPEISDVVNNALGIETDVVAFRNALRSTSYAVLDSGYKYAYDRYNDLYRWVPLNGDTAGLIVRTDETRDAWWSPAGFNRGMVKNVIRLAWNPNKSQRDILYKSGVNPVTTFVGEGTVLFGDKTLLAKPSAFDRINVRRLFIVLEKAIATAAKYSLFEFNDEFTRAQFKQLVEPYLRDVQGRRGIQDFRVVCDATNNTAEVIDHNQFVADIYIKPARSINFIQLNFVAVRTGVEFEEVIGKF